MNIQVNRCHKVNSIINLKAETVLNGALLAVSFLFYLLFPLCDGPVWCVDSASYETMNISREPLYPTFLVLMRKKAGIMEEQIQRSLSFVFIVILEITINSLVVGVTIFTQPRYMIYSMGFFYTAGCMLLYDVWKYAGMKWDEKRRIS